ncbi:MAG: hypothetical protein JW702_04855 [Clostridiales bacterium]|nr:hypothetical protein [Clostridiales bacterium]
MKLQAVYFFCMNPELDEVASMVFKSVTENLTLTELDLKADDYPILMHEDEQGNQFIFIRTEVILCQDHQRYQYLLEIYADAEFIGLVNWHGGANAPDKILSVHTVGDVLSGTYPRSNPIAPTNLMRSLEYYRQQYNLMEFTVTSEATHWSGIVYNLPIEQLEAVRAPMIDIEIGSTSESYNNPIAVIVIAKAMMDVFKVEKKLPVILYVGGMHFENTISEAIIRDKNPVALTHILPTRWLDNELYFGERGKETILKCIASIDEGIDGIVFHEKVNKAIRDLVKQIGEEMNIPVFKRKDLKNADMLEERLLS